MICMFGTAIPREPSLAEKSLDAAGKMFVMSSHDDDDDFKRFYLRIEGAFVYRNEASMIKSDYLNSSTVNYYLGVRGDFG